MLHQCRQDPFQRTTITQLNYTVRGSSNSRGSPIRTQSDTGIYVTHFQHMISHDAFGLDEDLVDHGVTMVTVHFMDAVLVKFGQRQQHP